MERRVAPIALAGASGLTFVGLAACAAGSDGPDETDRDVPPPPAGPLRQVSAAVDLLLPAGSLAIGRRSLAPRPGVALEDPDLTRLFPGDDWETIDGKAAMARLRKQVRRDFENGDTPLFGGWSLSWTEVELARVAYRSSIGHLHVSEDTRDRCAKGMILPRQNSGDAAIKGPG